MESRQLWNTCKCGAAGGRQRTAAPGQQAGTIEARAGLPAGGPPVGQLLESLPMRGAGHSSRGALHMASYVRGTGIAQVHEVRRRFCLTIPRRACACWQRQGGRVYRFCTGANHTAAPALHDLNAGLQSTRTPLAGPASSVTPDPEGHLPTVLLVALQGHAAPQISSPSRRAPAVGLSAVYISTGATPDAVWHQLRLCPP
jgi:hypothetical protein